jgi:putative transposase
MQTLYMLPDSQWKEIRTIIEPKERKRKVSLQVIASGIIYLLSNGCKWDSLPPCYGPYKLVWYYYNKWMAYGTLELLLYKLDGKLRTTKQHREAEPSLIIVDSQSVKTTAGTGEQTGYDGGKKVKGRKRHIAVDTQGNVVAAGITAANVHDKPGALSIKEQVEDFSSVKKIVADGAYQGIPPFDAHGRIEWEIVEKKAANCFKVLPKRWIVERTLAWLNNFRRLSKDYVKSILMSKAMLLMSSIVICLCKLSTSI